MLPYLLAFKLFFHAHLHFSYDCFIFPLHCFNISPLPSAVPPAYYAHLAAFRARSYMEGESDRGSATVGGTRVRNDDVKPLPQIKDNIKDVMFYC